MARYRKIDTRIWFDENFCEMDPIHKLMWFALLTHPQMTPLGAGVLSIGMLDNIIGNERDWCWRCNDLCRDHSAGTILGWFAERSMILCQNLSEYRLVVVKNFLYYNLPDNPNQLAAWIESIEDLPRSDLWIPLENHLFDMLDGKPEWLFSGLLKPLSNNEIKGLRRRFWDRIKQDKPKPPTKHSAKRSEKPSAERSAQPLTEPGTVTGTGTVTGKDLKKIYSRAASEILQHFNEISGHSYQETKHIEARVRSGAAIEDCKLVVDWYQAVRMQEWPGAGRYFRPSTLFNAEKFDDYRSQATRWAMNGRASPVSNRLSEKGARTMRNAANLLKRLDEGENHDD